MLLTQFGFSSTEAGSSFERAEKTLRPSGEERNHRDNDEDR